MSRRAAGQRGVSDVGRGLKCDVHWESGTVRGPIEQEPFRRRTLSAKGHVDRGETTIQRY
jgi:hypothetical protein